MFKRCSASCCALGLTVAVLSSAARADSPLDLTGWSFFDPDDDWTFTNPTPTSVLMIEQKGSSSVHPAWLVSDFTLAQTVTIEFDISVGAGAGDNDFMGFGFSYLDGLHSYLLDWKKNSQGFNWNDDGVVVNDDIAEQGLKIKRINGSYTWDGLWGGSDGAGVTTIAGPAGGAWFHGTVYHFLIELSPGHIVVTRDGQPLFDVLDPTFPGGAGSIAVYGFSQNQILCADIRITPPPADCSSDLNNDGLVNGADLGLLLLEWGPLVDCSGCTPDLNGDCVVDGADLGLLLLDWTG
jgi:hypothetical protein